MQSFCAQHCHVFVALSASDVDEDCQVAAIAIIISTAAIVMFAVAARGS